MPLTATAPSSAAVEPAPFVQMQNFLADDLHRQVLAIAIGHEGDFRQSSVVTTEKDYRRSRVLFDVPEFRLNFERELAAVLPWICKRLGFTSCTNATLETQLTAHNNGDYFKMHNDNGSPETAARVLSYVYYFNREPRRFTGGALRLYDSRVENGYWVAADTFHTIEPANNSIVFFVSRLMHEVLPIRCRTQHFADSRFTLNGWVRGVTA